MSTPRRYGPWARLSAGAAYWNFPGPAEGARVDGPLPATFTAADRALGWWYPTASMLSHSDSETALDLTYRRGGVGHDGYQQADTDTLTLLAAGAPYTLAPGRFYRVDSNAVIRANQSQFSGAHSDIRHPEVAWLALAGATWSDVGAPDPRRAPSASSARTAS